MSNTPERLTDDAITQFLRARSADPDLGLLDDIVRTAGATPQDRAWLGLRPILLPRRTLLIVAISLLLATMGAIAVGSRLLQPDPVRIERMIIIGQVIDAVNGRDLGSLRSFFVADGIVEFPGVDARAGREGDVYRHDQPLNENQPVRGWMRLLDTWDLEARLGSCRIQGESTISCAVATRWHVLQLEIGEEWTFDFDGARVRRLDMMARVDPDPANRVLPLGVVDLERWATWLRETRPEQADRLLPTGPDPFAHYYFRFGLDASADEIGASIEAYLESRDPRLGAWDLDAFEGRFGVEFSSDDLTESSNIAYGADESLTFIVDPDNAIVGTAIWSPLPDGNAATEDEWLAFIAETQPDAAAWLTSQRDDYFAAPAAEVGLSKWFGALCVGFSARPSIFEPESEAASLYMFVQYEGDCP